MSNSKSNPQKLGKIYNFMERFWLLVAIISTGLSAYIMISDGTSGSLIYIILPLIAIVYWIMRRRLRKSYERRLETEKQEQQS